MTLYAQYTANTYTVIFNANGGSGTMENQEFTYDVTQKLTANDFTAPTGKTLNGWNTKADGTGTAYAKGVAIKNLTTTEGETVTLYAQWTAAQVNYTVNYWLQNVGGGFTLVELIVVIAILAILAGVAVPAYSGYISSANKAADDQTIEAVNTAIASALAMEGKNTSDFDTYFSIDTNDTKKITPKDTDSTTNDTENKVWENFEDFYGEQDSDTLTFSFDYFTGVKFENGKLQGIDPTP